MFSLNFCWHSPSPLYKKLLKKISRFLEFLDISVVHDVSCISHFQISQINLCNKL